MSTPQNTVNVAPASALFQDMYSRLKAMAGKQRQRGGGPASVSTTEVVHELYLRMCDERILQFGHELEFFAYADPAVGAVSIEPALALELDTALNALAADSPRAAQVVELHYFAGLPLPRVAEITGLSSRTVDRDGQYARAFLSTHAGS